MATGQADDRVMKHFSCQRNLMQLERHLMIHYTAYFMSIIKINEPNFEATKSGLEMLEK